VGYQALSEFTTGLWGLSRSVFCTLSAFTALANADALLRNAFWLATLTTVGEQHGGEACVALARVESRQPVQKPICSSPQAGVKL